MEQIIETACDYFVPTLIGVCFLATMIVKSIVSVLTTGSRERSRREIAAYVAEGGLSPEQGERLLSANVSNRPRWT